MRHFICLLLQYINFANCLPLLVIETVAFTLSLVQSNVKLLIFLTLEQKPNGCHTPESQKNCPLTSVRIQSDRLLLVLDIIDASLGRNYGYQKPAKLKS